MTLTGDQIAILSAAVAVVGVVVREARRRAVLDLRTVAWLKALDGRLGAIEDALGIKPMPRARSEPPITSEPER